MTNSPKIQVMLLKWINLFFKLKRLQIMGYWRFCFSKQFCWIGWNSISRSLGGSNEASYEVLQKFIKNARCQVFTQWNQNLTYKGCKISADSVSNLEELSTFQFFQSWIEISIIYRNSNATSCWFWLHCALLVGFFLK